MYLTRMCFGILTIQQLEVGETVGVGRYCRSVKMSVRPDPSPVTVTAPRAAQERPRLHMRG